MNEASIYLDANRSRSNELSCAVVVLTLTAVETQLTKGFSLSPAATARHSDVASGKAADFPCDPRDEHEGWRASMLPTTTASSSSAATSSPRTSGGSAAPAVLQKLGHPNAPSQRRQYGSAFHADTYAPLLPPSVYCLHVSVCPRICVFISSVRLSASTNVCLFIQLPLRVANVSSCATHFSTGLVIESRLPCCITIVISTLYILCHHKSITVAFSRDKTALRERK